MYQLISEFVNLCVNIGSIPQILKDTLFLICKGGDRFMPKNYQPIFLSCHLMIMKRIVNK